MDESLSLATGGWGARENEMKDSLILDKKNKHNEKGGDIETETIQEVIVLGGGMIDGCDNYDCVNLVPRVAQLSAPGTQEDKLKENPSLAAKPCGQQESELDASLSLAPGIWGAQESKLSASLSMANHIARGENVQKK